MKYKVINLKTAMHEDPEMGGLSFIEDKELPFTFKRLYYIYKTKNQKIRGYHAHKKNWQLLYCPYGSITMILDDGTNKEEVILDQPEKGLVLSPGLWRTMIWNQDNSVLCVAASEYYDEEEYIRDYDEFLKYVNEKNVED